MTSVEEVLFHIRSEWETKIRNMQPGPELNKLVAKNPLSWKVDGNVVNQIPDFSGQLSAALSVAEYMLQKGFNYRLEFRALAAGTGEENDGKKVYHARFYKDPEGFSGEYASNISMAEAICKAALLAVMDNEIN